MLCAVLGAVLQLHSVISGHPVLLGDALKQGALPATTEPLVTLGMDELRNCQMKVEVIELYHFLPEIIFTVITDIPHHVDWVEEPFELVSLSDGPAKLGTKWEQNADRSGKKLVTLNTCNIYEKNRTFGWKSEKPFSSQVIFLLEGEGHETKLTWLVESKENGIVRLAEPLLIKQTDEMMRKSLVRLQAYLQDKKL